MDRNWLFRPSWSLSPWSLSARRAWIEICYLDNIEITEAVALRKESVDRNVSEEVENNEEQSRSPQGERG